jgi:hypothetical protein
VVLVVVVLVIVVVVIVLVVVVLVVVVVVVLVVVVVVLVVAATAAMFWSIMKELFLKCTFEVCISSQFRTVAVFLCWLTKCVSFYTPTWFFDTFII